MVRRFGIPAVIALLALNAVLLVAQPGLALPRALGTYLFGPGMVRAEVVMRTGGAVQLYRIDRGQIRSFGVDFVVLRERDGRMETVQVAPNLEIVGGPRARGRRAPIPGLRRGMLVEAVRVDGAPAERIRILRP